MLEMLAGPRQERLPDADPEPLIDVGGRSPPASVRPLRIPHLTRTLHSGRRRAELWHTVSVDARHPDGQYSSAAKWFHWLTVPPLAVLLASGLTIRFINDSAKMSFYTVHESLGLLVLLLSVARLTWRLMNPPPAMASHIPAVERIGAGTVHTALYAVLIGQPLLGFFTTNAYGFPQQGATAFLGFIDLPRFMDAANDLALALHWTHSIVGWLLIPLLAAHVGGVLYRHGLRSDGTLLRML
jgi:cytochrome b561